MMCDTWSVELTRSFTCRVFLILQVGYWTRRFLNGVVSFPVDHLVDSMVCNVWLKMSSTGEKSGEQSHRLVTAVGEDGAENCGVIYVFEPAFDAAKCQIGQRFYG